MKWIVRALVLIILVIGGGLLALVGLFPRVPVPDLKVGSTPELVARGRYLANHVAVCIDCHSGRDWRYLSGPIRPGTLGQGGDAFTEALGFPGTFYARNITPAALGAWTDGEIARAITSGVSRSGRAFFPVMPYPAYSMLRTNDLHALVAYLRTLAPIENKVPESRANFPMNLILRTIPGPWKPTQVNEDDPVAYGGYLALIGGCLECHTQAQQGKKLPGMDFAGGFEFPLPKGGVVRSSNITPDPETGIGAWTREQFVGRFKDHARSGADRLAVAPGEYNTVMPWVMYSGMREADLNAIYAYLRTVPAVQKRVTRFTPGEPAAGDR